MSRRKSRSAQRAAKKKRISIAAVIFMLAIIGAGAWWFVSTKADRASLDENLCPPTPEAHVAVIVDVTDPLTLPQRQDLRNKLEALKASIPMRGRVAFFKVDAAEEELLTPLFEKCNPGTAEDFSELDADLRDMERRYREEFEAPYVATYETIFEASGASRSPIMQSVQSVNLTELDTPTARAGSRRLILISDLLQNSTRLSFYGELPSAEDVLENPDFQSARTNLRGTEVELWMLQRPDFSETQPRGLPELWTVLLQEQGAARVDADRISG